METAIVSAVMLGLAVVFSEPVFILVGLMRSSNQESSEGHHVKVKGKEKRRRQLRVYTAVTITVMALLLIAARKCWLIWTAPVDYNLAVIPADPSDAWAAAAVGLAVVALLCLPWLMILRAKFKAVRLVSQTEK